MPDKQKATISISDAIFRYTPAEYIGNKDLASLNVALKKIAETLELKPELFKNTELGKGVSFRATLEGIVGKGDSIPKLYAVTTKNPDIAVDGLSRDYHNMAIDIKSNERGDAIRIGRFDRRTFEGSLDSNTYGIALVSNGEVKAGIAITPRVGTDLSAAASVDVIIKGE